MGLSSYEATNSSFQRDTEYTGWEDCQERYMYAQQQNVLGAIFSLGVE